MTQATATQAALRRLERTLTNGNLPNDVVQRGAELLARLRAPVNVVVMGPKGGGKSRLINMLLGENAISPELSAPVLEVTSGESARTTYLSDDTVLDECEGYPEQPQLPAECNLVRIHSPAPRLQDMRLTEVTLAGSQTQQQAAADWALRRADIVLWCTQSFDALERSLWNAAPEALKDHSFLVLSKADQLMMKGVLPETIEALEDIVAQEFYSLYPVATIQAISARMARSGLDQGMWDSSGGKALSDAVNRLVQTGRSADTDNALVYLRRYAADLPDKPNPDSIAPTLAAVAAEASARQVDDSEAEKAKRLAELEGIDNKAAVCFEALEFLQEHAGKMLGMVSENPADHRAQIFEHCIFVANSLVDILMRSDEQDPDVTGLQDDAIEGADMMMLFQLEKTDDAATDAVSLLLQIKRELTDKAVA